MTEEFDCSGPLVDCGMGSSLDKKMWALLDVSGRPETRDYGKALEALKLLTENVSRGPHKRVMGTTCL